MKSTPVGTPIVLMRATRREIPGLRELLLELGAGEHGFLGTDFGRGTAALEETLWRLEEMSEGINLAPGWVPMTTYWLLDAYHHPIGIGRLRHELTESLLNHGGHIGYYIRRANRKQGLGTALLAAMLDEARQLGIDRILLTAHTDNRASVRVIEANGGKCEDVRLDDEGTEYGRFWIEL